MSNETSLLGRLKAALVQDGDAEPQARDERPIAISREEYTQEPDREDIERWTREYYRNPLIRQSVRNFAGDVLEPGVTPVVDTDGEGDAEPTVTQDYAFDRYQGMDLSDALGMWLSECAIVGGRFDRDIADLLEDVILDLRGRRGTALVEHAYDDPEDRNYILGLRTFKAETATAYTREGKSILLRPDDEPDADEFDTVAIQDITGDFDYDGAPSTPAGKTAAFVQFDDTAQGIKSVGYGHWLAQVDTADEDEARNLLDSLDPSTPENIDVVNYAVDLEQFDSDVPDTVDHIQQTIEYILASLPTPLYRVGFGGDINRDVTDVQQDDYQEAVARERDRLESALSDLLHQKAVEFVKGDAKAETELDVEVGIRIEPETDDSPLVDEEFDADEFSAVMQGLKAAAPGGAVEQVVPVHEVRQTFLGLDPEPPEAPEMDAMAALPDEADERVQKTFEEAYDARLATRYSEGDEVETPDGVGVVVDIYTEDGTFANTAIEASESSPTYIVATEGGRPAWEDYAASDLEATTIEVEGVDDPTDAAAEAEAMLDTHLADADTEADEIAELGVTDWDYPPSWRKSPTPNRIILLKAWAGMGGSFSGCQREMRGEIGRTAPFCAAMKDRVLLTEDWR